jgi:hypothetical protein
MTARIALYCLLGGLASVIAALGSGHLGWWWLSGIILAAAYVPVARFGPPRPLEQFAVILLSLFVVGGVCTISEGMVFLPAQIGSVWHDLAGSLVMYVIIAAVLALLMKFLKLNTPSPSVVKLRSAGIGMGMLALSGVAYLVYYFVFGGITYKFFTHQYYPDVQNLVTSLGVWFWVIEWARGVLMTLAVLPIIQTLRMRRWQSALVVGIVLWVVGGAAPLLVPNTFMVPAQRYIHIVEIFTQNFLLGVTAVFLLRSKTTATPAAAENPA